MRKIIDYDVVITENLYDLAHVTIYDEREYVETQEEYLNKGYVEFHRASGFSKLDPRIYREIIFIKFK